MPLNIENVKKTYSNGVRALKGVDLSIGKGMFGLLGPNGAGKSTIMRTLATLQEPDAGKITFEGADIVSNKNDFRRKLGYLPQDFGVYPKASAVDLLTYFARLKGVSDPAQRKRHVDYLLEMVNLASAKSKAVDTYSGGMRQRFGIAQALIGDPSVIIVDEPTAGLDPAERNRFYGILHRIGDDAVVMLSTHIVSDVTNLCKDMAIMNAGEILVRGAPTDLVREIDGKIWRKNVSRNELDECRRNYKVISTRLSAGEVQVIIVADDEPGQGFQPKAADLEDLYFSHIPEFAI